MLTSVRHIAFLHTLSNRVKIPSSKWKLKLEMDVKICHFETGFMVEDIVSQNDDSQQQLMLHVYL